jgi:hypothetical protein
MDLHVKIAGLFYIRPRGIRVGVDEHSAFEESSQAHHCLLMRLGSWCRVCAWGR